MNDPNLVQSVFDGMNMAINGGKKVADVAFTTIDAINSIGNSQPQQQLYSRRDTGYQMPAQQMTPQYRPSTYPWEQQTYGGYGFTQQGFQNSAPGYPGISNPNYGLSGYYGQTTFGSSNWSSGNNQFESNWWEHGLWG